MTAPEPVAETSPEHKYTTYRRFDIESKEWVYDALCYLHETDCPGDHEVCRG